MALNNNEEYTLLESDRMAAFTAIYDSSVENFEMLFDYVLQNFTAIEEA